MKGKIKWYNSVKGYGFIETTEGKDVFIHQTGITPGNEGINEGDEVEFEVEQTDRGVQAKDLKKI